MFRLQNTRRGFCRTYSLNAGLLQDYSIEYYPESDNFHVKPQNHRLDYSLYYHFFYYLVEKYGKDKMINYMELMILDYKLTKHL